jgi:hypothetical protein
VQAASRGLWVLSQLPVKDGQLFVELAPGFHEFVESCPSLGVGGVVARRRLWVHADVAFAHRVVRLHGRCPPGRHRAGGGAGRA